MRTRRAEGVRRPDKACEGLARRAKTGQGVRRPDKACEGLARQCEGLTGMFILGSGGNQIWLCRDFTALFALSAPRPSLLAPRPLPLVRLAPHPSPLAPHTSPLASRPSPLAPRAAEPHRESHAEPRKPKPHRAVQSHTEPPQLKDEYPIAFSSGVKNTVIGFATSVFTNGR